jgi:hypothetical protein
MSAGRPEARAPLPPPPAHVAPFVEALGAEATVALLLRFGGAEMHVARRPRARSAVAAAVGPEAAARLAALADRLPRRWPLAKEWLARCLHAQGLPVAEIARRLHASDVAVRGWLKRGAAPRRGPDARQLPLL